MKTPETKYTPIPGTLDEPNRLHGFAARYNEQSEILFDKTVCKVPFVEVIKPGAFTKTLRENGDIRALNSHDKKQVLGRTKAGTLKLTDIPDQGLYFDNSLPDVSYARDLRVSMQRGDVDGCSFFGYVVSDEIEYRPGKPALRTIYEISLIEITPATAFPAYTTATAAIRSQFPELFELTDESNAALAVDQSAVEATHAGVVVIDSTPEAKSPGYPVSLARARLLLASV